MQKELSAERDRYMAENQGQNAIEAGQHFEKFARETAQKYFQEGGFSGRFPAEGFDLDTQSLIHCIVHELKVRGIDLFPFGNFRLDMSFSVFPGCGFVHERREDFRSITYSKISRCIVKRHPAALLNNIFSPSGIPFFTQLPRQILSGHSDE